MAEGRCSGQTMSHGRQLAERWGSYLVEKVSPLAKPWPEYRTHSDEVEVGSHIGWPINKTAGVASIAGGAATPAVTRTRSAMV